MAPMLSRLSVSAEERVTTLAHGFMRLGVSARWPTQELGSVGDLYIAADTDLTNRQGIQDHLKNAKVPGDLSSTPQWIAALYRLYGLDFVKHLEGAFAVAIWDGRDHRLLLATDPLGIKTLYYTREGAAFLFASRAGSVQAALKEKRSPNAAATVQYLIFSVVTAPLSIYQNIERLPPGYLFTFSGGRENKRRYWDLTYVEEKLGSESSWRDRLREQMRAAVHRNLEGGDRENTGAYLSGGTDSSSVVAFMSDRFSNVNCCSISFPVSGYNEIEYARATAKHFNASHHELCLSPADAIDAIPKVISYFDEPFANSSALASYHCALLGKHRGLHTMLAGDGGDELFAGNERYASDKRFSVYQSIPRWLRKGIVEPFANLLPANNGALSLPGRYIRRANIPNPRRIFSYSVFLSDPPDSIFEPGFLEQAPPEEWMTIADGHFKEAQASSDLNRIMHLDLKIILADNDLRKVSGTAELAGVRVRYPLLDRQLAEFSGTIPTRLKLKGSQKRYIFKKAMEGILPSVVLHKKKHGFGVPIGNWFLQDPKLKALAQDVLNDPRTRQRGYFKVDFYRNISELHRREHAAFYGEVIWYLVALELWHREHFDSIGREPAHED
jgi:asparagine synthase (glutamine-hydrolysing)